MDLKSLMSLMDLKSNPNGFKSIRIHLSSKLLSQAQLAAAQRIAAQQQPAQLEQRYAALLLLLLSQLAAAQLIDVCICRYASYIYTIMSFLIVLCIQTSRRPSWLPPA